MNKEKTLANAKELYEINLKQIEVASKICDKVDPLLPKDWKSDYDIRCRCLSFERPKEGHASEFRMVCGLVDKAMGIKLHRDVGGSKHYHYLYAHSVKWLEKMLECIHVRVELGRPQGCEVTFKRSWSAIPIVDEKCLGIPKPLEVTK